MHASFFFRKHLTTVVPDLCHDATCNVVLARMYEASFFFSASSAQASCERFAGGKQPLLFGFFHG
jgi:hypothetical protein